MESIKFKTSELREINQYRCMLSSTDEEQKLLAVSLIKSSILLGRLSNAYRISAERKLGSLYGYLELTDKLREKKDRDWYRPLLSFMDDLVTFNMRNFVTSIYFEEDKEC